jgi:signal transduction histidine kinase
LRWLDRERPNVERAKATLNNIVQSGRRAAEIVESLWAISKKENQTRVPLSLNELIRDVLLLVEIDLEGHHVALRTTLDETIPEVLADRVQLRQVLLNLINNAVEAMDSVDANSRLLHVRTERDESQNIVVTVQDSGPGIDPQNIKRIFDRFFTTKTQGMGMGLAISRSIIEAHNGRLWAEASLQQGSLFRLTLPHNP